MPDNADHDPDVTIKRDPNAPVPEGIIPTGERAGERIGHYKLLQELGEGGFGSVWMAEQMEPVSRRVALKIIKLGMDTREVIARFEQERQALAMMDHPNIAKVFDAGTTDKGRPFFVMELVKGLPITKFCDDARLGTRERLELFGDVCSAINHAHQKGIIHRDIKPSNVMVTLHGEKPVVKVIDFGIAKATQGKLTDKTLFTRFEQFVGTPVYMSPEQASLSGLDIDTRSDIYALGILLYELLTGKPPFDGKALLDAGYEEMRRIIREVEPPRPSTCISKMSGEDATRFAKSRQVDLSKLKHLVESDLDWIVMKAIDKDRTRRYETANALKQDIVRFLADEPVSATPPSAGYQFRKFAQRHRAVLRVAVAIVGVLVAATVVSTWQAVRATRAEKKTAAERDAKEQALKDAEAVAKILGDVFQSPDPKRNGYEIKVVELLDIAAPKLDTQLAGQPAQRAKLQATLAKTYSALHLDKQAIPLQEKVRDYYLTTFGPEHPDTLNAMTTLGIYYGTDRREESIKLCEEVLRIRREVLRPEHPDTITAMDTLSKSLGTARRDDALKLRDEVLRLRRKVLGPEHPDTITALHFLANIYVDAGRKEEALKMREEVLRLRRKVLGPEHHDTLAAMRNLANSYEAAGRGDEVKQLRSEILPLRLKTLGPNDPAPTNEMESLALALCAAGRPGEAVKLREEILRATRKALGPNDPNTLGAMFNVAYTLRDAGRLDEAIKQYEEMLADKKSQEMLTSDDKQGARLIRTAMKRLADCYREKGDVARAEAWEKKLADAELAGK